MYAKVSTEKTRFIKKTASGTSGAWILYVYEILNLHLLTFRQSKQEKNYLMYINEVFKSSAMRVIRSNLFSIQKLPHGSEFVSIRKPETRKVKFKNK